MPRLGPLPPLRPKRHPATGLWPGPTLTPGSAFSQPGCCRAPQRPLVAAVCAALAAPLLNPRPSAARRPRGCSMATPLYCRTGAPAGRPLPPSPLTAVRPAPAPAGRRSASRSRQLRSPRPAAQADFSRSASLPSRRRQGGARRLAEKPTRRMPGGQSCRPLLGRPGAAAQEGHRGLHGCAAQPLRSGSVSHVAFLRRERRG
jgi:hypothetical protein